MNDIRYDGRLDIRIDNIGYVKVMRNEGFTFPYKKGKEKYSIIIPESGSMSYYFINTDETVLLYPGDIIFIPCKCPYIATYLSNNTAINLFIFDTCSGMLPEILFSPQKKTLPELAASVTREAEKYSGSTLFLAGKIYELLAVLAKNAPDIPKKYKRILPALKEIEIFFHENRKLSYYSELCGMSESNFRKLFAEYTGRSFIEHRNLLRLDNVRKLTDSAEYNISEAAYLSGFNNMSFFYETAKKHGIRFR